MVPCRFDLPYPAILQIRSELISQQNHIFSAGRRGGKREAEPSTQPRLVPLGRRQRHRWQPELVQPLGGVQRQRAAEQAKLILT